MISKKIPIMSAFSLAFSSWVEQAFSFTCHICWALKLMGCFWKMEIDKNTAAVSILKERCLGVVGAFMHFTGASLVQPLWMWSCSWSVEPQVWTWLGRKYLHIHDTEENCATSLKKNWAEHWKHIMFLEEITLFQSFKKNSEEILFFLKR